MQTDVERKNCWAENLLSNKCRNLEITAFGVISKCELIINEKVEILWISNYFFLGSINFW